MAVASATSPGSLPQPTRGRFFVRFVRGTGSSGESGYDVNMTWEKDGSSLEIRTQGQLPSGRPALDEIVASGAVVHLEQMAHDHWWMGLEAGGKYFHLNFGVQDGRLWVHLSDQGEENAEWENDSRERPIPGVDE
jgi:hypothetical protein